MSAGWISGLCRKDKYGMGTGAILAAAQGSRIDVLYLMARMIDTKRMGANVRDIPRASR